MYAHQVISSLEKFSNMANETRIPTQLINAIKNSQMFHFGEANDLKNLFGGKEDYDSKAFSNPLDSDLRLPYPKCWFDYKTDITSEGYSENEMEKALKYMRELKVDIALRRGYLVQEVIPQCLLSCVSFSLGKEDDNFWSFAPIVYYVGLGISVSQNAEAVMGIINDKNLPTWLNERPLSSESFSVAVNAMRAVSGSIQPIPMVNPELTFKSMPPTVISADIANLKLLEKSIRILNCKNIVTEEVDNSFKMKIGKKIKKFASKTKFKYHILNVTLPNSRKTYINSPKTGKAVRVHMCRGHYRHYVDKGLFGKYYGRFWIQDHVRGNKKKGMLVKDYNIRPNPEFA